MGTITLRLLCRHQGSGLRSSSLQDKYFAHCPISPALCLKKEKNNGSLSETKIWVQEMHLLMLRCHCGLNLFCCWSKRVSVWELRGGTMHAPSRIAPHVTICVSVTLTLCSCPHLPANPLFHMTLAPPPLLQHSFFRCLPQFC